LLGLAFHPKFVSNGYLYVALGDGGSAGDPFGDYVSGRIWSATLRGDRRLLLESRPAGYVTASRLTPIPIRMAVAGFAARSYSELPKPWEF
jgi:hypothetical protein